MARKLTIDTSIATDIKSAASDSFKDNIKMIEIGKIKESMDNFYSLSDIEILAEDIRVYTSAPVRFAKAQDILMSVRAPVGDMNIAMNDCCIGRGLAAIHHESTLYAWCAMQTFKPYFDVFNGSGTTFGALTSDDLKGQVMVVPSNHILKSFIEIAEPIGEKMRLISMENQQLASLRDFLLPMLMNGQVKVGKGDT